MSKLIEITIRQATYWERRRYEKSNMIAVCSSKKHTSKKLEAIFNLVSSQCFIKGRTIYIPIENWPSVYNFLQPTPALNDLGLSKPNRYLIEEDF